MSYLDGGELVRRVGVLVAAGIALILASALGPVTAVASTRTFRSAVIHVRASNGYRAYVFADKLLHPRLNASISIVIHKGATSASYTSLGRFTKNRLRARLRPFGVVNLRYESSRRRAPGRSAIGCFGASSAHHARFRGRIRFEGEDGYTRIRAWRADGSIGWGEWSCPRTKRAPGTFLTANSGSLRFKAKRLRRLPGETFFYATEEGFAGRVRVVRHAFDYRDTVFDFNRDLSAAHVESGGAGFSGSADFASPDQWTGDLSVSFPGEPDVALTGPEFTARLRRVEP